MTATDWVRNYRKARREAGKCGTAACPNQSGDEYYCEPCRVVERERHRERRLRVKLAKQAAKQTVPA